MTTETDDRLTETMRRIEMLWGRYDALDEMASDLSAQGLEGRAMERAQNVTLDQLLALEDYALATPATSLAGAASHIILALGIADRARTDSERREKDFAQIARALYSALKVVEQVTEVDLTPLGRKRYAPDSCDPFPTVAPQEIAA